jgi:GDP-4-dehydro-6-deoxy-D-mannose reductase
MMSSMPSDRDIRVLFTGGRGFVGSHLRAFLAARRPSWTLLAPSDVPSPDGAPVLDVTDQESVDAAIADFRPDILVHLAAVSTVNAAMQAPRDAWRVNFDGTLNVVMALQHYAPKAHLLFISSAQVYGASLHRDGLTGEDALLQPLHPYAASKASADILVRQSAAMGLSATVMRPFNHIGPGQAEAFMAPNFAGQIARIEAGLQEPVLSVGSLDDERDFLDVQDVVRAYADALDARATLEPGEVFNVASGKAVRIGEVLDILLSQARVPIEVRVDASRLRTAPMSRIVGDASHLREKLHWRPEISLEDTLSRILQERRTATADQLQSR